MAEGHRGAGGRVLLLLLCCLALTDGFFQAGHLSKLSSKAHAVTPTCASALKSSFGKRHAHGQLRSVTTTTMSSDGGQDDVDMDAFRALLTDQWNQGQQKVAEDEQELDGYKFRDMIVEKWGVPYDIQIQRQVLMGKPMLFLNVMWKYLGQQTFYLSELEYLEHLQAISDLLIKWDRVEHVKKIIRTATKRPNAYFGYAVPIPLDLPAEVIREIDIPETRPRKGGKKE